MNKTNAVQLHLIEKGSITSWEAIKEYGATRLSAIIFRLRHERNMNIINERVYFVDRFGTPSHYDIYKYIEEDENENNK